MTDWDKMFESMQKNVTPGELTESQAMMEFYVSEIRRLREEVKRLTKWRDKLLEEKAERENIQDKMHFL